MTAAADARQGSAMRSGRQAALTLWLPVLVPLVTGMLRDCDHCLQNYLLSYVLVPGILAPALLRLDGVWFGLVGGVVTLLLFGGLWILLGELPRPWRWVVQVVIALAITFEAIGFAHALRA